MKTVGRWDGMVRAPEGGAAAMAGRPPATLRHGRLSPREGHDPVFLRDRYSSFVSLTKLVLPLVALGMLATVAVWPSLQFSGDDFRVGFLSSIKFPDVENLTLVKARYLGADENNRPFTVTADMASQASPQSDIVALSVPAADITLEDGKWVALTAKTGEYHQKARRLVLKGQVSLFHDDGYNVQTEVARIDLKTGNADGNKPVVAFGPAGKLNAEGFRIIDKGRRVVFTGRAHLVMRPGQQDGLQSVMKGQLK